jgi:hypothetical protein
MKKTILLVKLNCEVLLVTVNQALKNLEGYVGNV